MFPVSVLSARGAIEHDARAAEFRVEKTVGGRAFFRHQPRLVEAPCPQTAEAFVEKKSSQAAATVFTEDADPERQVAHLVAGVANGRGADDAGAVLDRDEGHFAGGKGGVDNF